METTELKKLPEKELLAKVQEIREKMFHFGFKAGTEEVTNPAEMRVARRDIARIHQILSEMKLAGAPKKSRLSRAKRVLLNARKARMQAAAKLAAKPTAKKAPAKPAAEKKA